MRKTVKAEYKKSVLHSSRRTTICTHNVRQAKSPELKIMVGMREHFFHLNRGESRPVGVDEICCYYSVDGISVKGIEITHIPKIIKLYFLCSITGTLAPSTGQQITPVSLRNIFWYNHHSDIVVELMRNLPRFWYFWPYRNNLDDCVGGRDKCSENVERTARLRTGQSYVRHSWPARIFVHIRGTW